MRKTHTTRIATLQNEILGLKISLETATSIALRLEQKNKELKAELAAQRDPMIGRMKVALELASDNAAVKPAMFW